MWINLWKQIWKKKVNEEIFRKAMSLYYILKMDDNRLFFECGVDSEKIKELKKTTRVLSCLLSWFYGSL